MDHPIFSTERELVEHFRFTYLPHLEFENEKTKNRFLRRYERAKKTGDELFFWQGSYYQKEIENPSWPAVYIGWVDEVIGYGVFASAPFSPKMYVGEYTGLICQKKFRMFNLYSMALLRHVSGWKKFLINGEMHGNFTRFINHSTRPNLNLQVVYLDEMPHMIFTANRRIAKGEQLTFDYGESYWRQCQKIPKVL
jgi:hypothetical protein